MTKKWEPLDTLFNKSSTVKYAIVILNREIQLPCDLMLNLWKNAHLRVTVDGGTNKWLSWLKSHSLDVDSIEYPSLITGDMDSISKETMSFFMTRPTVKIIATPDQNHTDFTKALLEISKLELDLEHIVVLADTNGRLDHIFALMNTLYRALNILPNTSVYQLASDSVTWLLVKGTHCIKIPKDLHTNEEWCGLVPLGKPCSSVTTTGLKWNLSKNLLQAV